MLRLHGVSTPHVQQYGYCRENTDTWEILDFFFVKRTFPHIPSKWGHTKKGTQRGIILGKNTYTLAMPYVRKRPATLLPGIFLQGVININCKHIICIMHFPKKNKKKTKKKCVMAIVPSFKISP